VKLLRREWMLHPLLKRLDPADAIKKNFQKPNEEKRILFEK
jgi:hypothetical protein